MILPPVPVNLPNGTGWVTLETYEEDGVMICGIYEIKGTLDLPPKQWLRTMREQMTMLENVAREAGCVEMRVAGRDWSAVLTLYEPYAMVPNGLRKVL